MMTSAAKKLLEDALRLSDRDRADLAVSLIESLDSQVDPDAEAEWNAEIHRRIQDLDNRCVASVSWTETRRIIREGPDARFTPTRLSAGPCLA